MMRKNQRLSGEKTHLVIFVSVLIIFLSACTNPASFNPTQQITLPLSPTSTQTPTITPTATNTPIPIIPTLSYDVPEGTEPDINGKLSPSEWDDAKVVTMSNEGQLLLMHANGYLFLGIQGDTENIGSICQYKNGEVLILHSSGGYTTTFYTQDVDGWQLRAMFFGTYTMQLPESAWQDKHLEDYGWTASRANDGNPGEYEFQIAIPDGEAVIAVNSVYGFGDSTFLNYESWPENLNDDCGRMELSEVVTDISRLQFAPKNWVNIIATDNDYQD